MTTAKEVQELLDNEIKCAEAFVQDQLKRLHFAEGSLSTLRQLRALFGNEEVLAETVDKVT